MRKTLIQSRKGTATEWTAANPVLSAGEPGFEVDTKRFKIGDGTTSWNELEYIGLNGGEINLDVQKQISSGSNVSIDFTAPTSEDLGVGVTFSSVESSGTVSLTRLKTNSNPDLPSNFSLNNSLGAYNITTTSTFSGNILIKFILPSNLSEELFFSTRIFHLSSGVTSDATVLSGEYAPNFSTKTIYASVTSFSEFYIIPSDSPLPTNTPAPTASATPTPTATPEPTPTATPEPQFNFIGGAFTATDPGINFINRAGRLNSDGTLDNTFSIGTGFSGDVNSVVIQGDGKILVGGSFTSYNGISTNRIARLNSDGTLDNTLTIGTGFNNIVNSVVIQDDGKILVGGSFTSYNGISTNRIARLNSDGTLDNTFSIGTGFNSTVNSVAVQGDGKILVGGWFTSYNGISTNRIARLNSDGTLDNTFSIGTGFDETPYSFAIQGDGKILVGGSFASYNGISTNRIARLNSDGTLDNTFSIGTGFSGNVSSVNSVVIQGDGKILVGGSFTSYNGTSINRIARLNSDGTLDNTFSVGTGFNNGTISVVIQGDGKILVGGLFTSYNGTSTSRIARLNSDGTLDNTFSIGTGFNSIVRSVAIQGDGKILVGGGFASYNGTSRNRIARLNSDGTLDNTFSIGTGFDNTVNSVAVQGDGKILAGGNFTSYNGTSTNRIARLNSDGTLDNTFSIGTGFSGDVNSVVIQGDGKILVGGWFTSYNGISTNRIARLNSDGTLDNTLTIGTGFNNIVRSVVIQGDGKILVGGSFASYNGISTKIIARLNSDGTLDNTFSIGTGFNSTVNSVAIQGDGKILAGGQFTSYNGTSTSRIARLNSDGTLDNTFSIGTGFNSTVRSVAIQGDGKILAGGSFFGYNGTSRNRIARLNSDGTLDNTFSISGFGFNADVNSVVIQGDGKILVGGGFTSYNVTLRSRIARLNSDGTLDTNFDFDTNNIVNIVI